MKTDFFKWNSAFETGITRIDIQHKVIVKVLNELYNVVIINKEEEKIDEILNELVQYTICHFGEEEKIFDKYNYIDKKEHQLIHSKFKKELEDIISKRKDNSIAVELISFLKDWLIDHIMNTDQEYVKFFNKKGIVL